MWVRLRLEGWDNLEVMYAGKVLPIKFGGESLGYLQVYDSLEELLAEYPEETKYQEIIYEKEIN